MLRIRETLRWFRLRILVERVALLADQAGALSPTSALWCEEPLENQGPVDFSVTMRLASLPGFYWTYDLCRHPKRLVQNPLIWLGCPATTNPQNSVLVGRQNDRRDLVLRQQVAHRPP